MTLNIIDNEKIDNDNTFVGAEASANKQKSGVIPVFYACDDDFIKYAAVSLKSVLENSKSGQKYKFHFLVSKVNEELKNAVLKTKNENSDIEFFGVEKYMEKFEKKLPVRDWFTKTTYFRLFIADMFPEYDKAIYLDGDTVVSGDLAELYNVSIEDYYLAASPEAVMRGEKVFGEYVEKVLGVDRYAYFNAGVLVLNCKKMREKNILEKFSELLACYNFSVTQDEDYLNVLCKDRVLLIDSAWNKEVFGGENVDLSKTKILHYIMTSKPWRNKNALYADLFWSNAEKTVFYNEILSESAQNFAVYDEKKDAEFLKRLKALALSEIEKEDNYLKKLRKTQDASRVEAIKKIEALEKNGVFDVDVENDPPTKPLKGKIDYAGRRLSSKIKSKIAFSAARVFLNDLIKNKKMIVKDIIGAENLRGVEGGAILTCNHFSAYDSFAMQVVYETADIRKHKFFRVIREGNYTSFGGFYGYLMRNCNTLPLSSDVNRLKDFYDGVAEVLKDNGFVLIYAEQSMWWNYRKPKPLKKGAFSLAAKNSVPIVPCFITMRDSDVLGDDGFYVQEYTMHVSKPVYPYKNLSTGENVKMLKSENERMWKEIYESVYGFPLKYSCDD